MKIKNSPKVNETVLGTIGRALQRSVGVTPGPSASLDRQRELAARKVLGKESYREFRDQKIVQGLLNRFGGLVGGTNVTEQQLAKDAIRFAEEFFASRYGGPLSNTIYLNELITFITAQGQSLDRLAELPAYFDSVADKYNEFRDKIDKSLPADRETLINDLVNVIKSLSPKEQNEIKTQLNTIVRFGAAFTRRRY